MQLIHTLEKFQPQLQQLLKQENVHLKQNEHTCKKDYKLHRNILLKTFS